MECVNCFFIITSNYGAQPWFFFRLSEVSNNTCLGKERYFIVLHICSPNLLCKKKPITFCPSKAVCVVRVLWQPLPEAKLRGISCTGLGELAERGWELWAPFPHFPGQGAGVHSLCSKLRSVEMLLPCLSPVSDVFLLLLAFITHFFPLQELFAFFFPDFSAGKHTLCSLIVKQKLGLCKEL